MSQVTVPVISGAQVGNTLATPESLVLRDGQGGVAAADVTCTSVHLGGNFYGAVSTQTSNFTLGSATDYLVDCTAGAVTATLPAASVYPNCVFHIMKKDSSANAVTLTSVVGTTTLTAQYQSVRVFSDSSVWYSK